MENSKPELVIMFKKEAAISINQKLEISSTKIQKDKFKDIQKTLKDKTLTTVRVFGNLSTKIKIPDSAKKIYDKLKLDPSAKKTKTGQYQTGEDVLLKLAAKGHPIVDCDVAASIANHSSLLQFERSSGHTFATHA